MKKLSSISPARAASLHPLRLTDFSMQLSPLIPPIGHQASQKITRLLTLVRLEAPILRVSWPREFSRINGEDASRPLWAGYRRRQPDRKDPVPYAEVIECRDTGAQRSGKGDQRGAGSPRTAPCAALLRHRQGINPWLKRWLSIWRVSRWISCRGKRRLPSGPWDGR